MIQTPQKADVDLYLFFVFHSYVRGHRTVDCLIAMGKKVFFPYGFKAPKSLPEFPADFPDVCVCLKRFSPAGSTIRRYCPNCKGAHENNYLYYFVHDRAYGLGLFCKAFNIPYYYALSRYAILLYQRGSLNENTPTKQSVLFRFANIAQLPEEILS